MVPCSLAPRTFAECMAPPPAGVCLVDVRARERAPRPCIWECASQMEGVGLAGWRVLGWSLARLSFWPLELEAGLSAAR